MKITHEYIKIEADAKELRESNTLASCFGNMLRRAFQPPDLYDYEEEQEEGEEESE